MSIKIKTKEEVVKYIEDLGHTLEGELSHTKSEIWNVVCGKCTHKNKIRLHSLLQIKRTEKDIVCVRCKEQVKVQKFLDKNSFELLDYTEDYCDIKCKDCTLKYRYRGDFFDHYRCYCKLQIKQEERQVYEYLQESYPEGVLEKEYHYNNISHKVDIKLTLNGKVFYIEVDDESHFTKTGTPIVDKMVMELFLYEEKRNEYFIRIPIKSKLGDVFFENLNSVILNENPEHPKLVFFKAFTANRYEFHAFDQNLYKVLKMQ